MTAKNFNEATAFLDAIGRIWGLRNFTRTENKIRLFFSWLYNVFLLCLSIMIILLVELRQLLQLDYKTEGIVYKYLLLMYIFMIAWTFILGWYHSQDLLRFKKLVCKVDDDLQTLGSTCNYRSLFLQMVLTGSLWLFSMFVVSTLYLIWMMNDRPLMYILISTASHYYGCNVGSIMLLDFKTNVFWLGMKFKQVNELLNSPPLKNNRIEEDINTISRSVKNSDGRRQIRYYSPRSKIFPENYVFNSTYKPRSVKTIFQQIRLIHQELCCITKVLSKTFDAQLLVYAGNMVVYLTVVCYYLCIEIRKTMSIHTLELNLLTILIIDGIFDFTKICMVTYSCEYTMKQANKTTELIQEFALYQADPELKEEILQFCLQISHARLGKSKIDLFCFNYTFLRGCIGFVTTYLIIVIQFSKSSETTYQDSSPNTTSN